MTQRWRVGFARAEPGGSAWWQRRLLRPGFAHVWATRRIMRDCWLWLEWTPEKLLVGMVSSGMVRRVSAAASCVLVYDAPLDGTPRWSRLPWPRCLYCVSLVADALSVPVRPWATPWALSCALRKRGAWPLRAGGGVTL